MSQAVHTGVGHRGPLASPSYPWPGPGGVLGQAGRCWDCCFPCGLVDAWWVSPGPSQALALPAAVAALWARAGSWCIYLSWCICYLGVSNPRVFHYHCCSQSVRSVSRSFRWKGEMHFDSHILCYFYYSGPEDCAVPSARSPHPPSY